MAMLGVVAWNLMIVLALVSGHLPSNFNLCMWMERPMFWSGIALFLEFLIHILV
jgi:hypothetical protein